MRQQLWQTAKQIGNPPPQGQATLATSGNIGQDVAARVQRNGLATWQHPPFRGCTVLPVAVDPAADAPKTKPLSAKNLLPGASSALSVVARKALSLSATDANGLADDLAAMADAFAERLSMILEAGDIPESEALLTAEAEVGREFVRRFGLAVPSGGPGHAIDTTANRFAAPLADVSRPAPHTPP